MKKVIYLITLFLPVLGLAQQQYEPTEKNPYGMPNPAAPQQLMDFKPMIGLCDCSSTARDADGSWADAIDMTWKFKYIMNGMAIQDETLKSDGKHSGSIRQFNVDSSTWYVHYYATASVPAVLSSWTGNKKGKDIIFYREQKAPNGTDGFYRLSFYDITNTGYKWVGEWVSKDESVVYPTWKIECKKRK